VIITSIISFALLSSSWVTSATSVASVVSVAGLKLRGQVGTNNPTRAMSSLAEYTATPTSTPTSTQPTTSKDQITFRSLLDASIGRSRKVRGGNYVQLATVTPNGEPRVRTVVQRGMFPYDDHSSVFKFITDIRSEKVGQIKHSPKGEIVWWFLKTSEQYRISGNLTLVGNEEKDQGLQTMRKQTWGNLRDGAREQFFWPQPGIPLNEPDTCTESTTQDTKKSDVPNLPEGGRDENGKVVPPPDEFLLMLMWPSKVDYLRLTDNYRLVFERKSKDEWTATEVNP